MLVKCFRNISLKKGAKKKKEVTGAAKMWSYHSKSHLNVKVVFGFQCFWRGHSDFIFMVFFKVSTMVLPIHNLHTQVHGSEN